MGVRVVVATRREFQTRAMIGRPPPRVWAFMTDPANAPTWIQGVQKSSLTTPGPMAVGSRIRETRKVLGTSETYDVEVRAFEPPRRLVVAAIEGKTRYVYAFDLVDSGGATDISMRATIEGAGFGAKLKGGLVAKTWEKYEGDRLQRLKAAVEARP